MNFMKKTTITWEWRGKCKRNLFINVKEWAQLNKIGALEGFVSVVKAQDPQNPKTTMIVNFLIMFQNRSMLHTQM